MRQGIETGGSGQQQVRKAGKQVRWMAVTREVGESGRWVS